MRYSTRLAGRGRCGGTPESAFHDGRPYFRSRPTQPTRNVVGGGLLRPLTPRLGRGPRSHVGQPPGSNAGLSFRPHGSLTPVPPSPFCCKTHPVLPEQPAWQGEYRSQSKRTERAGSCDRRSPAVVSRPQPGRRHTPHCGPRSPRAGQAQGTSVRGSQRPTEPLESGRGEDRSGQGASDDTRATTGTQPDPPDCRQEYSPGSWRSSNPAAPPHRRAPTPKVHSRLAGEQSHSAVDWSGLRWPIQCLLPLHSQRMAFGQKSLL